jgi:hypothetical protein
VKSLNEEKNKRHQSTAEFKRVGKVEIGGDMGLEHAQLRG